MAYNNAPPELPGRAGRGVAAASGRSELFNMPESEKEVPKVALR